VSSLSFSQNELWIYTYDQGKSSLLKAITLKDSSQAETELNKQIEAYQSEGYLLCRLDSDIIADSVRYARLNTGPLYEWLNLSASEIPSEVLQKAGFKTKYYNSKPINPKSFSLLKQNILKVMENNGYPFSSVELKNIEEKGTQISAGLFLGKGPLIMIDTIEIRGNTETNPKYIRNYLDLWEGQLYNEKLLASIGLRLKESPFLQETKENEIYFENDAAKLFLFIDDKKANVIDGVLGVLPSEQGDVVVSGDIKLQLLNSFKQGDKVQLKWRKLQDRTQDFKLYGNYPFLLNTPIDLGANLFLYRRDTLFSTVRAEAEIAYRLKANNKLKLKVGRSSSSIISSAGLSNISQLPEYADVAINFYGLGADLEDLDYRYNPTRGYQIEIGANTGQKIISENPAINPELYDSLSLKSTQFELNADLKLFIPLLKRSTILQRFQGGWLKNDQLFNNELFRIGGIKTLRGFDIESIFASLFGIYSLEYRFLLERNSYLFAFADMAYYENTALNNRMVDRPIGFGAGMSFETKAGIFSLSYALGRQQQNPILLRTGKVHFGLVNYF